MILIILLIALILRFLSLNQSLWLDEAINVNAASSLSFQDLIFNYSKGDFHPPLYHALLKTVISFFGSSEIAIRTPSVLLGVGTVYVTYLIAKKLFEKKTALIASTLLATAPLHIYYSQEARMYMLAAFFASLSAYFFISLLKRDTIINWIGFIVSSVLMLYTDYLPYLMLVVYFLFLIFTKRKVGISLKSFLPASILIVIAIVPWLVFFPAQLKTGLSVASETPAWAAVVGSFQIKDFFLTFVKFTIGRISNDNNLLYALYFAPVGFFVTLLFFLSTLRMSAKRAFIWFWFLTPTVLGFLISFLVPVHSYFRYIFVLPAFYIIWAAAINTINWPTLTRALLFFALLVNIGSSSIYLTNPKFHRENWREATDFIIKNSTDKSAVLFESTSSVAPFDYYSKNKNVNAFGALDSFSPKPEEVEKIVKSSATGKDKIYLFQYLSQITDPQGYVFEQLNEEGFRNSQTKNFVGVGFLYEFVR